MNPGEKLWYLRRGKVNCIRDFQLLVPEHYQYESDSEIIYNNTAQYFFNQNVYTGSTL